MDTSQWPQGIGVMEGGGARRTRPQKEEALNCPRCNSTNTKFCYYNNYSLSQPRYFCKTCRRYWTDGGSLRNVPVGGGSRKNKRSSSSIPSSSSSAAANSKIKLDHHVVPLAPPTTFLPHLDQNPSKIQYQGQDLNLAYPPTSADHHLISKFVIEMPHYHNDQNPNTTTTTSTTTTTTTPAMELFKTGFMSVPGSEYPTSNGFNQPSGGLSFSLDGLDQGGGYGQETNGARLLFPFEDAHSRGQGDPTAAGYWSGMLGGGDGGSW